MTTLFTQIIQGTIPCHKLYEDDVFFSFLDINPINPGHTLIVPKQEIDYFFDLDEGPLSSILIVAKPIAAAIKKATNCKRVGLMVGGLEVPHAHLHLVPITSTRELNFTNATPASPDALSLMAKKIISLL